MKKIISIFLAVTLIFALCACGSKSEPEPQKSPAQQLLAVFNEKLPASENISALAQTLVETLPFSGAFIEVESGYLNGFTNEISGFENGVMFAPMIGSIPFVGYIFELDDTADTAAFIDLLKENADLRWNICTSADEMVVDANGQTVFFVMSPLSFES